MRENLLHSLGLGVVDFVGLEEENKQLKDLLIYILGFGIISTSKSEMEKLEELKKYVRGINKLRRDSKPPI
jgi:hypothetical protein